MRGMRKIKLVFNMGLKPALKNEPPADRRAAQRKTHKCVAQLARDQRSRFTPGVMCMPGRTALYLLNRVN